MKKFLSFLVFVSFCFSTKAQLFNQDFNASTVLSQYVSSSPNSGQFEAMSPDGASLATTISNGVLRFNRTGAAGIYAYRNFTLSANPTFVQLKFDFEGSNFQSGTQTPVFSIFVGNAFTSTSSGSTSNFASRIGVIAQPTAGEFKIGTIDNIEGAPSSGAFTGKQTITFIINNSGEDKSYTAPDGSVETVANGKMDTWVGLTRSINDFSLKNTDAKGIISGFKIQATSASGTGVFDFDNIEFKDLSNVTPPPPAYVPLPDTPPAYLTLKHPFIWASYPERQKIVDNINQFEWANSLHNQLKSRVEANKNAHIADPETVLKTIPPIPGTYSDRTAHTDILASMVESAILYYLTDDNTYAQYAADILNHYMKYLSAQEVKKYREVGPGLMFDDGWLEKRALFPRIALGYDFLYNFVNNSNNTIYELSSQLRKSFDDSVAQTTVTNLADIVFMSIIAPQSNHSILAGNGALFPLLMIADDTKREQYLNRFLTNTNETFDAYNWSLSHFTENGVWPEPFGYSKGSHELIIQSLNVIDRYKPNMNIIDNHKDILGGFIGYANFFYPSDEFIRFGDTGLEGDMTDGYRWILRIAARKNLLEYKQFAEQNLKYYYNKTGGYQPLIETDRLQFHSPLQLLWGENIENLEGAVTPKVEATYHLKFAGIVAQRNYETTDIKNNGLMYYSGGSTYVHAHSSGIDMELYGKGFLFGAESGSGTYNTDEHDNYRVRNASHNTVIANGSGKRGGSPIWENRMNEVTLVASEPKHEETPIASNFSFSTQFLDDSYNSCLQQRTNSIVRTSVNSGYYIDIFRSKGKTTNNFHDYIYHNIGDAVTLKFDDNTNVSLSSSNKYNSELSGSTTGWTFFENVISSTETSKGIAATFSIDSGSKSMHVLIPSGTNREYATALAPNTKGASNGYDKKKTPIITMRKNGEAWDEPFIAIFEPTENSLNTVKTVSNISINNKIVGVKVVSEVEGQELVDVIISNDEANNTLVLNNYDINFTGRFAIVRTIVKNGKTDVELYIGEGESLTFNGKSINADTDKKAFLSYTLDYSYEPPVPSIMFTIQSIGETCPNKKNGIIKINANSTSNCVAILNGATYNFSENKTIESLAPGNYNLCIAINGTSFEQCYNVVVANAANLSGKITLGKNNLASVSITEGTAPYTVIKNGACVFQTHESEFSLEVNYGDQLEVRSNIVCEGLLSKQFDTLEGLNVYPNPSNGLFEISLPYGTKSIEIDVYNVQSQMVSSKTYMVKNGKVNLDISNCANGVYFLKLKFEHPKMIKFIKN